MKKNVDIWNAEIYKMCKKIQFTSKNTTFITLSTEEFTKYGSEFFIKSLKEMMKNLITVKSGRRTIAVFPIFALVQRARNSNEIECHFHDLAIRYLLYFGNGAGMYSFDVAISLGSARFSRLYKILSANLNNKTKGEFSVSINGFKEEFFLTKRSYNGIESEFLLPLQEKLKANKKCAIAFDFQPITDKKEHVRFSKNKNHKGRPIIIGIKFHVYRKNHATEGK